MNLFGVGEGTVDDVDSSESIYLFICLIIVYLSLPYSLLRRCKERADRGEYYNDPHCHLLQVCSI
jgi:hypothetical protein